ncbi:MAG: CotH kinase family protein [Lachnospiraceae bacterium]|nr:CotH kinase family protein [Lachnospiraceae bacterium]
MKKSFKIGLHNIISFLLTIMITVGCTCFPYDEILAAEQTEKTGIAAAAQFFAYIPFGNGRTVNISVVNTHGRDYLFLPSSVSLSGTVFHYNTEACEVTFTDGKALASDAAVNLNPYLSADTGDGSRLLTLRVVKGGVEALYDLHVMNSANISSMFLSSSDPAKGRTFVEASKSNKAAGNMTMLTSKGTVLYDGGLTQIKGRGNSTFAADKKPYQIKLDTSSDLTRKGSVNSNKTWVLLANAYDPTLIHNTVGLNMAQSIGLDAPDCVPVDLYYDGEYRGNYLLAEKVQIAPGRVDITDLEAGTDAANPGKDLSRNNTAMGANKYGDVFSYVTGVANPESIAGGYLLELDNAYYKGERSYFITSTGIPFVVKSPENCSKEQMIYISEYVEDIVRAAANGGVSPDTGDEIWKMIDRDSLVRYFVLEEIVKNADSFASSTYFYLNDDGKPMKAGPVWDLDDSYGVRADMASPEGFVSGGFIQPFMNLPDFRKAVKAYYSSTGHSRATSPGIDSYVKEISQSQKMNRVLWNDSKQLYSKLESYDADIAYMKNYASERAKWLKGIFATW